MVLGAQPPPGAVRVGRHDRPRARAGGARRPLRRVPRGALPARSGTEATGRRRDGSAAAAGRASSEPGDEPGRPDLTSGRRPGVNGADERAPSPLPGVPRGQPGRRVALPGLLGRARPTPRTASRRRSSRPCAPTPGCEPESNLRAWVLTIAHRKAVDCHRGRARRALPVADVGDPRDARSRRLAAGRPDARCGSAVRELPPRQRSAVVLRFLADLAHRDIAAAIGCSEDAARRSLHEGLKKLRAEVTA